MTKHTQWLFFITPLFAGAALPFAFAPFNLSVFGFLAPALLCFFWLTAKPGKAFMQGLLFGLGFFGVGTSWIFISVNTYGNTPLFISLLITAAFLLILSLFIALQGYLQKKIFGNKPIATQCLFIFPTFWVLSEFGRTLLFNGFPWLLLGYSQLTTPIKGFAPFFGVTMMSFITALISGLLVMIAAHPKRQFKTLSVIAIFALIGLGFVGTRFHFTQPAGKAIKTTLVQGNIPQKIKWSADNLLSIIQTYKNLTDKHWNSDLIIWPEASIPAFPNTVKPFLDSLNTTAKTHNATVIVGIPLINQTTKRYYNSLLMLGKNEGQYRKQHLVAFGEYIPLEKWFDWFVQAFQIPMSNFSEGASHQPPLQLGKIKLAPFICYEIAFPSLVWKDTLEKNLLVVITDDSWFGQSIALNQHLQIAQMRALETQRYLVLAANSGITAVINPEGRALETLPINTQKTLTTNVLPLQGKTPVMRWKNLPLLGLLALCLLLTLLL